MIAEYQTFLTRIAQRIRDRGSRNARFMSGSTLGVGIAALLFAALPSRVGAQCGNWDVGGSWALKQSDGVRVHMQLSQNGTTVAGSASYHDHTHAELQTGGVQGKIVGNHLDLRVIWKTGNVGDWTGTIQPNGIIQGRASDEHVRSYTATFVSDGPMNCPQPTPPPQAPPPQPPSDGIKRGSFVILQSLPPRYRDPSHDLVVGGKYEVIGSGGGSLTIRGPSGRPHHLSASSVKLAQ